MNEQGSLNWRGIATLAGAIVGGIFLLLFVIIGTWVVWGTVSRWQARANANNQVHVRATNIRTYNQQKLIEKAKADIRKIQAVGIRNAQDEISKTLTPLYVQFEMTQVLGDIARSGRNNSVVYLPSGANGIPLVSTLPGPVGPPTVNSK